MTDSTEFEFGGKCAFATSLGGPEKAPEGKKQYTLTSDGKTYVFLGAFPRWAFKTFKLEACAQKKWAER